MNLLPHSLWDMRPGARMDRSRDRLPRGHPADREPVTLSRHRTPLTSSARAPRIRVRLPLAPWPTPRRLHSCSLPPSCAWRLHRSRSKHSRPRPILCGPHRRPSSWRSWSGLSRPPKFPAIFRAQLADLLAKSSVLVGPWKEPATATPRGPSVSHPRPAAAPPEPPSTSPNRPPGRRRPPVPPCRRHCSRPWADRPV